MGLNPIICGSIGMAYFYACRNDSQGRQCGFKRFRADTFDT
jgi:hypothetical protein